MTAVEQTQVDGDAPVPGWYPDPFARFEQRYFDGSAWTADVSSAGVQVVDPQGAVGTTHVEAMPLPSPACGLCGRSPAARVTFHQGIGMLVLHKHKYVKGALCRDCGMTAYKTMQGRTLATGWWGFISFFVNIIYIVLNFVSAGKIKKLEAPR